MTIVLERSKQGDKVIEITTREIVVDEKERRELIRIYCSAFDALAESSPVRQSYDKDELIHVLLDSEIDKTIAYHRGKIMGFSMISGNLDKVPWANKEYYKKKFPKYYERGAIYYVKGISVDPKIQNKRFGAIGQKAFSEILKNTESDRYPDDSVFCFDCSMSVNGWMSGFVDKTLNKLKPFAGDPEVALDYQGYFAYVKSENKMPEYNQGVRVGKPQLRMEGIENVQ